MSRTEDRALADRVDDLEHLILALEPLHIQTEIVVVRRHEPWASEIETWADVERLLPVEPEVEVVETRRDLDLLIDPRTKARKLRHEVADVEGFDRIAARAKLVKITITVHEGQLEPLLCTAGIVALLGGNRGGKTRVGLWWLFRQWMLRGPGLYWLLAPTLTKAWKRLVKDFAPLIPIGVRVGKLPKSHRSARLVVRMIDGAEIEALHTNEDGGNLKSENVAGILFDEAAESPDVGNWQQVNSRVSQRGAAVFLPTTPKAGHWAHTEIVLQEPHAGGAIRSFELDLFSNPWLTTPRIWKLLLGDGTLTQTELEEQILPSRDPAATCRAIVQSPRALREHFGVWTADGIRLWSEWTDVVAQSCTRAGQAMLADRLVTPWGELEPITAQASSAFFDGVALEQLRVVGGQDFNVNPQTTLLAQVFGKPEDPSTWVLYFADEIQTQGTVELHGERLKASWPGLALACDPSGDIPRRIQQEGEGEEAERLRDMGFECRSCVGRGRRLTSQKPTINLVHYLIRKRRVYVHLRCRQLLKALQTQQAKPDGRIAKRSGVNSKSDQLSAPTDAARYLAWALFRHELEGATEWAA